MTAMVDVTAEPRSILALSRESLAEWCARAGVPEFRAEQIRRWLFAGRANRFEEMQNLPAGLRDRLSAEFAIFQGTVVARQVAADRTEKLLLKFPDGSRVECVLMRETRRRTVCISTQVGCAMGCVFCASGLLGLKRNLTSAEILEQVLRLDRLLGRGERITNLVVMGIGEPLANLKNLLPALDVLHARDGLDLGVRRMTISTVGLPDQMRALGAAGKPYNLAVSLHAPNDELRNELVPVNRKIGVEAILAAADEYFTLTGRRVTYEYVLLGGVNDGPEQAEELAHLLAGRNAHVNLIPMNAVRELDLRQPAGPRTQRFAEILRKVGVAATVRKRKGADIDAACGQLRLSREPAAALG